MKKVYIFITVAFVAVISVFWLVRSFNKSVKKEVIKIGLCLYRFDDTSL